MTLSSMTGFARIEGADDGASWYWELRSVNGRGLDVRFRVPPGCERLEVAGRALVSGKLRRGNVTVNLTQRKTAAQTRIEVNQQALAQILEIADSLRVRLKAPAPSVENLLGLRGVLEVVDVEEDDASVEHRVSMQLSDLEKALDALTAARGREGEHLTEIVVEQLGRIEELVEAIADSPKRSADAVAERLKNSIARLTQDAGAEFDENRLYQEALLLASKADVEEELQRLRAHVVTARELLEIDEAVGRRLDFLAQEFNREANTLCSKANDNELTRLGLELKAIIEQMREQVQNIE